MSWIHEKDFVNAVEFLIDNEHLDGNFNLCVPKPTDNGTLMTSLRKALNVKIGISHPQWLLKIGARLLGTETELVLKSRNVVPKRLLENGFVFKYTDIATALNNLVKK